jgi:hypothetical protein
MTTYFVATMARYVLVDAPDEDAARELARPALYELYAETRARLGRDTPIEIQVVRPATTDEIDLMKWHHEMVARHAEYQTYRNPA